MLFNRREVGIAIDEQGGERLGHGEYGCTWSVGGSTEKCSNELLILRCHELASADAGDSTEAVSLIQVFPMNRHAPACCLVPAPLVQPYLVCKGNLMVAAISDSWKHVTVMCLEI